jgi:hypothetical protein
LTKIGPSRSQARRRRTPRGSSSRRPSVIRRTSARTQRWRKARQRHLVEAEAQDGEDDQDQAGQLPHREAA